VFKKKEEKYCVFILNYSLGQQRLKFVAVKYIFIKNPGLHIGGICKDISIHKERCDFTVPSVFCLGTPCR